MPAALTPPPPQQHQATHVLDVLIVGAGLAGLASAVSAALSGHHVTVVESAKELLEVGAGLQVTPNATRILRTWNVSENLWRSGAEPSSLSVHRYTGKLLAHDGVFGQRMRDDYGHPFVDLHRVDLQLALYERAKDLGVKFVLGQRVEHVDFDGPSIRTGSGLILNADLIVAADGLWSRCRSDYTQSQQLPRPTGDLAYRVVLRLDQIDDPELRAWVENPTVHFWIGPGAHAVGYSLRGGEMYNIVLLVPDDIPDGVGRQAGSVPEMRALFKDWDPILGKFLDLVEDVDKWKLMHRDELSSWVNEKSNVVFVGDSCHPMLPYLAQGANSAIEDGAVLGLLLGHLETKDQLPQALKMYERLRKSRGDAIARETFKQRESFHMHDGPEQLARDEVFASQLGAPQIKVPFPSRWTCPEVQPWLYGYDAFAVVEQAVQEEPFVSL